MTEYERREYIVLYECDGDSMFDTGTKERIVRCKDCEHYREEYEECMRNLPSGLVVIFDCESHDFCSFGKRKKVDA